MHYLNGNFDGMNGFEFDKRHGAKPGLMDNFGNSIANNFEQRPPQLFLADRP